MPINLKEKNERAKIYCRLEKLYYIDKDHSFRHFYSDIFSVLTGLKNNMFDGNMEFLGQNLAQIRSGYQPQNKDDSGNPIDISDNIRKLYDHVSLDIARIHSSEAFDNEVSGEENINNLKTEISTLAHEIKLNKGSFEKAHSDIQNSQAELKAKQELLDNDIKAQQKDYITILSVFSAVVLAFTGGIAFSTSVFNNISNVSIYRIITISLLLGLVLIDVIFLLLRYVSSITKGNNKDGKKGIFAFFIANAVIAIFLFIIFLLWNCGYVEQRNSRINNANISSVPSTSSVHSTTVPSTTK